MATKPSKARNQTFQWLEALAILMVIDDHTGRSIGILSNVFPYDSFFMPMLVFVSGYFYKEQTIRGGVIHKISHLLIPYLIWSFLGEAVAYILSQCIYVRWYVYPFTVRSIQNLFFLYPQSPITGAGWFVSMLFWVEISYLLLSKLMDLGARKTDYLLLILLVILGFFDLKFCMDGMPGKKRLYLFILRTIWYLQFYHMGKMFHMYWEKYVQQWRLLYTCGVCVAVNVLFICLFGEKVNFFSTSGMGKFNSWWLPVCTSVTGTLFWYKIMQMIASRIGQVNIVDFVAENTFTIMMCHLMFANIPNFIIYLQVLNGSALFSDFPVEQFVSTAWVHYSPVTCLASFFCGLLGSLLVALFVNNVKEWIAGLRLLAR